jgi:GT2 family glycosyltransferase
MELSVIIVNWNSLAYVRQCLNSLQAHCGLEDTEIIVVDGGSFDGCDRMLAAEFPQVVFVQSPDNVGFARANNLGVQHARGRHLLFLNPDTLLLADSLAVFRRRLRQLPHAAAVGGRLLNGDRTVQTSCIQSFPTLLNQALDAQWLRERFPRSRLWGTAALASGSNDPAEVEAISGACLAVTREAFIRAGGFTTSYFMYGEDIDLCWKLRRAGGRVYYLPETSVVHFGGGSSQHTPSDRSVLLMRAAVQHFLQLHRGAATAAAYRLAMGAVAVIRLGLLAFARRGEAARKWSVILRWSLGRMVPPVPAPALRGSLAATPTPEGI